MAESQGLTGAPEYKPITEDEWRLLRGQWAREWLSTAWAHLVTVDSSGSRAQNRDHLAARALWVETTQKSLAASTSTGHFAAAARAAARQLEVMYATESTDAFALFGHSSGAKLIECVQALERNPLGSVHWADVTKSAGSDTLGARLKRWADTSFNTPFTASEAVFKSVVGVARLATGLSVIRVAGFIGQEIKLGWMALERVADPMAFVSQQIREARHKFSFASVALEGQALLSPDEQSRVITKGVASIERAAKFLGVEPKSMGMDGWNLQLINESTNLKIFDRLGYTSWATRTLAIPATGDDNVHTIAHEWTHMLDFKLGTMARALAARPDSGIDPLTLLLIDSTPFFSGMPPEAQKLIPLARAGLGNVMGAAQGVTDGAAGFEALAAQRAETLESLTRRMTLSIAGAADPDRAALAHLEMTAPQFQALHERLQGPIKHLLDSKMLDASLLSLSLLARRPESARPPSDAWNGQWERTRIDPTSSYKDAIEDISNGLDSVLGTSWRERPDSTLSTGTSIVAGAIGAALDQSPEAYQRYSLMRGTADFALNPESNFAKASKIFEALRGDGYKDSQHEMFARAVGRPGSVLSRTGTLARLGTLALKGQAGTYDELNRLANSPELDARAQAQMALGWSQLTEAAGFKPATLARNIGHVVEAAALSPIGRSIGAKIETWLEKPRATAAATAAAAVALAASQTPPITPSPSSTSPPPELDALAVGQRLVARRKITEPTAPLTSARFEPHL